MKNVFSGFTSAECINKTPGTRKVTLDRLQFQLRDDGQGESTRGWILANGENSVSCGKKLEVRKQ